MAYYADLTPFTYSGGEPDPAILNVGWLCRDHLMPTSTPSEAFILALTELTAAPVNLYRGFHLCDFCPRPPSILSTGGVPMFDADAAVMGNGEIRVKGRDGRTYVAPTLVLHYVLSHRYAPPTAFVDAVIAAAG